MEFKRIPFLISFLIPVLLGQAQSDSLRLMCPLVNGTPRIVRASDRDYQKSSEYGVILTSKSDTTVQAVHEGAVVIVTRTEDTKYDVVLQYRSYYFWFAGVLAPKVRQGA